jgi:hypothetical protein
MNFLAPIQHAVRYVTDTPPFDLWTDELYSGAPSHESDAAWNEILHRKHRIATQRADSSDNNQFSSWVSLEPRRSRRVEYHSKHYVTWG